MRHHLVPLLGVLALPATPWSAGEDATDLVALEGSPLQANVRVRLASSRATGLEGKTAHHRPERRSRSRRSSRSAAVAALSDRAGRALPTGIQTSATRAERGVATGATARGHTIRGATSRSVS